MDLDGSDDQNNGLDEDDDADSRQSCCSLRTCFRENLPDKSDKPTFSFFKSFRDDRRNMHRNYGYYRMVLAKSGQGITQIGDQFSRVVLGVLEKLSVQLQIEKPSPLEKRAVLSGRDVSRHLHGILLCLIPLCVQEMADPLTVVFRKKVADALTVVFREKMLQGVVHGILLNLIVNRESAEKRETDVRGWVRLHEFETNSSTQIYLNTIYLQMREKCRPPKTRSMEGHGEFE
jgi:hypothetical protein